MPKKEKQKEEKKYESLTSHVSSESMEVEDISTSDITTKKETPKNEKKVDVKKELSKNDSETPKKDLMFYFDKFSLWMENQGGIPLNEKIFFIQNLAIMLKAGLSLGQALEALKQQSSNKKLKHILEDVSTKVQGGTSFADALATYPKDFNNLFISMVSSGELSGNLEEVLHQLHIQLKRSHELISKVKGALIYPAIVIVAMFGIGAAMIIFVVPKFISIFEELQAELPLPTKIMIAVSNFVQNNGFFVAFFFILFVIAFIKFVRTKVGRRFMHRVFLITPILSTIVKKINLARFARTVSSLIKTDIPIVKSFQIASETMGNVFYKEILVEASEKIKKGSSINEVIREHPKLFPPVITQMITVGEQSGSIDEILSEVANFYEEEVDQTMKNLPSIIEPILMLVLGVGVGFMAVSILMPMYSMSDAI